MSESGTGAGARASGARASSPACEVASEEAATAGAVGDNRDSITVPRGWHSRGYLPHYDAQGVRQFITYRLADSLPAGVAARLAGELHTPAGDAAYRRRIETVLDSGLGSCWLRRPDAAALVLDSWRHFDGQHYDLLAWVVMPNHVHVMIRMREVSLSTIIKGWKSFTARQMNHLLRRTGQVWQEDYWDRYIRDSRHFAAARAYIHNNPVKAGLAAAPEDWAWSSAGARASSPATEAAKQETDSANAAEDSRAPRHTPMDKDRNTMGGES